MTATQRLALVEMMDAILKCDCAPADIRFRAENLRSALAGTDALKHVFDRIFR